jgi:carbamoyl-phosphate synthase large subunit
MGATWINTAEQARNWVKLWVELRGFNVSDFTISEFLPGRDYAFQSVWKNGELRVAKMVERLSYVMGRNRLSNMSSTPAVARTIRDTATLDTVFAAIRAVSSRPHGNYNLDLKGNVDGVMCVTEFNIGRFCMITPIFDLTGRHNTADVHVASALDLPLTIQDPVDIEEDVYLIRELDTEPLIISARELDACVFHARHFACHENGMSATSPGRSPMRTERIRRPGEDNSTIHP